MNNRDSFTYGTDADENLIFPCATSISSCLLHIRVYNKSTTGGSDILVGRGDINLSSISENQSKAFKAEIFNENKLIIGKLIIFPLYSTHSFLIPV